MRVAVNIELPEADRKKLERWATSRSVAVPLRERSRIMLRASGSSPDLCVKAEEAPRLRLGCLGDLLFLEE